MDYSTEPRTFQSDQLNASCHLLDDQLDELARTQPDCQIDQARVLLAGYEEVLPEGECSDSHIIVVSQVPLPGCTSSPKSRTEVEPITVSEEDMEISCQESQQHSVDKNLHTNTVPDAGPSTQTGQQHPERKQSATHKLPVICAPTRKSSSVSALARRAPSVTSPQLSQQHSKVGKTQQQTAPTLGAQSVTPPPPTSQQHSQGEKSTRNRPSGRAPARGAQSVTSPPKSQKHSKVVKNAKPGPTGRAPARGALSATHLPKAGTKAAKKSVSFLAITHTAPLTSKKDTLSNRALLGVEGLTPLISSPRKRKRSGEDSPSSGEGSKSPNETTGNGSQKPTENAGEGSKNPTESTGEGSKNPLSTKQTESYKENCPISGPSETQPKPGGSGKKLNFAQTAMHNFQPGQSFTPPPPYSKQGRNQAKVTDDQVEPAKTRSKPHSKNKPLWERLVFCDDFSQTLPNEVTPQDLKSTLSELGLRISLVKRVGRGYLIQGERAEDIEKLPLKQQNISLKWKIPGWISQVKCAVHLDVKISDTGLYDLVNAYNCRPDNRITHHYRIKRQGATPTRVVILELEAMERPKQIRLGDSTLDTLSYQKRAKQCVNCLEYGHIKQFCRNDKLCATCSKPNCNGTCTAHCLHCRKQHSALSANCNKRHTQNAKVNGSNTKSNVPKAPVKTQSKTPGSQSGKSEWTKVRKGNSTQHTAQEKRPSQSGAVTGSGGPKGNGKTTEFAPKRQTANTKSRPKIHKSKMPNPEVSVNECPMSVLDFICRALLTITAPKKAFNYTQKTSILYELLSQTLDRPIDKAEFMKRIKNTPGN